MTLNDINSYRKYSVNISLNEAIDQVNEQLCRLLHNNQIHFSKRKKLLLQYERKNNQFRRAIDRSDIENHKKVTMNMDTIRRIKKKIIEEMRQQREQRIDQHQQNRNWSLGGMITIIGIVLVGIIGIATFVRMMLDKSNERYV